MVRRLALLAVCVVAGCGDDPSSRPPEQQEAADIAKRYLEGDTAGIDVRRPGQDDAALTLAAVRENGHWLLQDVPDEETP